ncbi:DUF1918 domain-containing protein [Streptomyces flavidovirens]|uniref:DUF1918 domain-containing protein n=1 Tax=Streptomyces flavidovirens TaxID=67298 RepID=UPI00342F18D7
MHAEVGDRIKVKNREGGIIGVVGEDGRQLCIVRYDGGEETMVLPGSQVVVIHAE